MILLGFRWRRRRGRNVGRPPGSVFIAERPKVTQLVPTPHLNDEPLVLNPAEYEVLRLIDLENLDQESAGKQMGISRGTVWRLIQSARSKVIQSIVEGRTLLIEGIPSTETPSYDV